MTRVIRLQVKHSGYGIFLTPNYQITLMKLIFFYFFLFSCTKLCKNCKIENVTMVVY